jgi:uncharacterized protein
MKASRLAATGAVAATAVVVLSSPAFAHVSVAAEGTAAKGGYAVVDFKVPNERDNASTTKLEVNFPTDHPLASVMPEPMAGWKIEVTKSKLAKPLEVHGEQITEAVSKVTWTAAGKDSGIRPGYFEKFPVSIGALPEDADELVFKAIQTYSNKEVVRWIEVQEDGAEEPETPPRPPRPPRATAVTPPPASSAWSASSSAPWAWPTACSPAADAATPDLSRETHA